MNGNVKKILLFLGLTFFSDWLLAGVFFALGGKNDTLPGVAMAIGYMFVPMIMAIIVQRCVCKEGVVGPLGVSFGLNRWFLVAWLLPPVVAFATLGVSLLVPGVSYSPEMAGMFERFKSILTPEKLEEMQREVGTLPLHPIWIGLLEGLIAGVTVNAIAAFGEELGWRGLLQKELGHLGFWRSSAAIGAIWGVWHAPLILHGHNYPEHPQLGVLLMVAWCMLLAPIFGYVRLRAKSVIAAAIMHGTLNGTYGLSIMVVKGGNDLTTGMTGLPGFIVLAVVNVALLVYERFLAKEPLGDESEAVPH
jgi:membrane protease YdiL (CAAX protease family)